MSINPDKFREICHLETVVAFHFSFLFLLNEDVQGFKSGGCDNGPSCHIFLSLLRSFLRLNLEGGVNRFKAKFNKVSY